jgi:hypothetical protein
MGSGGNLPVGPGLWGFIAAFVLALALWLLMRNMNTRMRRMAYRERDRVEREDAEQIAQRHTEADVPGPGPVPGHQEADSRRPGQSPGQ